jgi:hypothetical protein
MVTKTERCSRDKTGEGGLINHTPVLVLHCSRNGIDGYGHPQKVHARQRVENRAPLKSSSGLHGISTSATVIEDLGRNIKGFHLATML